MATATKSDGRRTKNRLASDGAAAKKAKGEEKITIHRPDLQIFRVKLTGTESYIQHAVSAKTEKQIERKQQQKESEPRGPRDPKAEYLAACYPMPGHKAGEKGCKYGMPRRQILATLLAACIDSPMAQTKIKRNVRILTGPDAGPDGLLPFSFSKMNMRKDPVRLDGPSRSLDFRYRPEFHDWSVVVTIQINARNVSADQVINLLANAGFSCGLAEDRPNSKKGTPGVHGTFDVESVK